MAEDYDQLIHGAFGDFTEDAESTITAAGTGDVRAKLARRRRMRTIVLGAVGLVAVVAVVIGLFAGQ